MEIPKEYLVFVKMQLDLTDDKSKFKSDCRVKAFSKEGATDIALEMQYVTDVTSVIAIP